VATRITKLPIGISEKVPGSGIYWIRYTVEGKKRREKVGTLSAAKDRLGVRHVQAKAGTLPNSSEPRPQKVTFAELVDDANKHLVSERTAAHAYDTGLKFNRKRQTKCMVGIFAAQAAGVRSAMCRSGTLASPGRISAR